MSDVKKEILVYGLEIAHKKERRAYPHAVDRIIDHLKLRFIAEKPPPARVFTEVVLMAAEESGECL